jgi:hypothetical protein
VPFFAPQKRRAGRKLTPEVCQRARMLLNKGLEVPEVGRRVGILANTLRKAIRDGRPVHNILKNPRGFDKSKSGFSSPNISWADRKLEARVWLTCRSGATYVGSAAPFVFGSLFCRGRGRNFAALSYPLGGLELR